ncbi:MAG: glycosyltransferase family 9 protein [Nanoarchaeota archaeon]
MDNILVIKLGALGDVVRTLSVVKAIKQSNKGSKITWVAKEESRELLENVNFINSVHSYPFKKDMHFDFLYNFDIEDSATELASKINAGKKYGFYKKDGFLQSFNLGSEYYLNTVFDDELKKSNKKTYQEMMFEVAELKYKKELVEISVPEKYKKYSSDFIKRNNIKKGNLIGIHTGASIRWPSKSWAENKIIEFIKKLKNSGYQVLLFGGFNEVERNRRIEIELNNSGISIYKNDPNNSSLEFISLVSLCKFMVCADSFALHVALALRKSTIGLFFCTSPKEVESYGLLKKLISPKLNDFFPARMNEYDEDLTNSISVDEAFKAIINLNGSSTGKST